MQNKHNKTNTINNLDIDIIAYRKRCDCVLRSFRLIISN